MLLLRQALHASDPPRALRLLFSVFRVWMSFLGGCLLRSAFWRFAPSSLLSQFFCRAGGFMVISPISKDAGAGYSSHVFEVELYPLIAISRRLTLQPPTNLEQANVVMASRRGRVSRWKSNLWVQAFALKYDHWIIIWNCFLFNCENNYQKHSAFRHFKKITRAFSL